MRRENKCTHDCDGVAVQQLSRGHGGEVSDVGKQVHHGDERHGQLDGAWQVSARICVVAVRKPQSI